MVRLGFKVPMEYRSLGTHLVDSPGARVMPRDGGTSGQEQL